MAAKRLRFRQQERHHQTWDRYQPVANRIHSKPELLKCHSSQEGLDPIVAKDDDGVFKPVMQPYSGCSDFVFALMLIREPEWPCFSRFDSEIAEQASRED
jgi:hypothetical protein